MKKWYLLNNPGEPIRANRRAHGDRPQGMRHANSLRMAKGGAPACSGSWHEGPCPPLLSRYKKCFIFFVVFQFIASWNFGQIEVPVVYDLGVASPARISGVITGGSICYPEGLNVILDSATSPTILNYELIDKIENLTLSGEKGLSMKVYMRDGQGFTGQAPISENMPILILQDEPISEIASESGRVRTFKKDGFRGIPLIEFEAELPQEIDLEQIKEISASFVKTLESGDLEKAVELHNLIGELLAIGNQTDIEEGPENEKE